MIYATANQQPRYLPCHCRHCGDDWAYRVVPPEQLGRQFVQYSAKRAHGGDDVFRYLRILDNISFDKGKNEIWHNIVERLLFAQSFKNLSALLFGTFYLLLPIYPPPHCKTVAFAVALLPNVSHALGCGWGSSPQIWSIGAENLFYIFFPLVMLFVPNKRMLLLLLIMTVGLAILPHAIDFVNIRTVQNEALLRFNQKFFFGNKFDSFLIGCMAGFAFAENHKLLKIIYNKWLFFVCAIAAIVMWGGNIETKHFNDELMSVLFAVVILNVCTNTQLNITFENRVTKFLGRISYGIYMYHWIILLLTFKILPLEGTAISVVVLYAVVITATIIVAWLSYETYEKFFLNLKRRFER